MDKTITPSFQVSGKRKKLVGYIGELRDGNTIIHSMEYSTYSQAEAALDQLVFELMSTAPAPVTPAELGSDYAPSLSQAISLGLVGTPDPVCKLCGAPAFVWINHEMYCKSWWQSGKCAVAEPATTCCFCHKPHHPQHCPEKNAFLFAPDELVACSHGDECPWCARGILVENHCEV